jgi:phage gp36-like protein
MAVTEYLKVVLEPIEVGVSANQTPIVVVKCCPIATYRLSAAVDEATD